MGARFATFNWKRVLMPVSKPKTKASSTAPVRAKAKPKVAARSAATAAKTSASEKTAVKTVTLKQIGVDLAAAYELPKRTVESLLNDMTDTIVKTIKKGSKVRISGIGILQVKKRAARMGRNPATGETIKIKASKKVSLSVARDLKEAL
jgi:DNA-binding protein HU-beta